MAVVTERLAVIIGGDAQGAVNAFHRTGKAAAGTDTVVARVTRNIERSFGGLGPILAGTAAVVGPAGVIGAAVAGSGVPVLVVTSADGGERVLPADRHVLRFDA